MYFAGRATGLMPRCRCCSASSSSSSLLESLGHLHSPARAKVRSHAALSRTAPHFNVAASTRSAGWCRNTHHQGLVVQPVHSGWGHQSKGECSRRRTLLAGLGKRSCLCYLCRWWWWWRWGGRGPSGPDDHMERLPETDAVGNCYSGWRRICTGCRMQGERVWKVVFQGTFWVSIL